MVRPGAGRCKSSVVWQRAVVRRLHSALVGGARQRPAGAVAGGPRHVPRVPGRLLPAGRVPRAARLLSPAAARLPHPRPRVIQKRGITNSLTTLGTISIGKILRIILFCREILMVFYLHSSQLRLSRLTRVTVCNINPIYY